MIGDVFEGDAAVRRPQAQFGLYRRYAKRVIDLIIVLMTLPAVIPVILILALYIKLDGGPAFYVQNRVGRGGRIFRMWKLRSMVLDADKKLQDLLDHDPDARSEWNDTQKLKRDPRITPVGQVIRKTSLDELPQIWNVLVGDMSLVGPRPVTEVELAKYAGHEQCYLALRPGVTGLWQVSGRNGLGYAERVRLDAEY